MTKTMKAAIFCALLLAPGFAGLPLHAQESQNEEFIINDKSFNDEVEGAFSAEFFNENGALQGRNFSNLPVRNGRTVFFGYDATHTWIGKVTYAGYTFDSSKSNPLVFKVVKDKGYVYLKGTGKVSRPDGTTVALPLTAAAEKPKAPPAVISIKGFSFSIESVKLQKNNILKPVDPEGNPENDAVLRINLILSKGSVAALSKLDQWIIDENGIKYDKSKMAILGGEKEYTILLNVLGSSSQFTLSIGGKKIDLSGYLPQ